MRAHLVYLLGLALGLSLVVGGLMAPRTLAAPPDPDAGLVVVGVDADGPAAQAGVVRGDVLLRVGDRPVNDRDDWQTATAGLRSGQEVTITLRHGDEIRTVTLTPGERYGRLDWGMQLYFDDLLGILPEGPLGFMFRTPPDLRANGVLVLEVAADSPAAQAGLQVGDRIVAVEGERLTAATDLAAIIARYRPGDTITLTVLRDGREQAIQVRLGRHPERLDVAYLGIRYSAPPLSGLPDQQPPLRAPKPDVQGAHIDTVKVRTPADRAGLKPGEVIVAVDEQPVADAAALAELLRRYRPGDTVTLTVRGAGADVLRQVRVTLGEHPDERGRAYLGVEVSDAARTAPAAPQTDSPPGWQRWRRFFDIPLPFGRDWNLRLPSWPFDLETLRRFFPRPPAGDNPGQGFGL
jgi:S1-C subfamily serine protease